MKVEEMAINSAEIVKHKSVLQGEQRAGTQLVR